MTGGLRKSKKNCEDCKRLQNPDSFAKGSQVRIFEAFDCKNCEVFKCQPIEENENIIELYNALPNNYDGYTGLRIFDANAVKFLFDLFDVAKDLQDDYYCRLVYFHGEIVTACEKVRKKDAKRDEEIRKWKEGKFKSLRSRRTH